MMDTSNLRDKLGNLGDDDKKWIKLGGAGLLLLIAVGFAIRMLMAGGEYRGKDGPPLTPEQIAAESIRIQQEEAERATPEELTSRIAALEKDLAIAKQVNDQGAVTELQKTIQILKTAKSKQVGPK